MEPQTRSHTYLTREERQKRRKRKDMTKMVIYIAALCLILFFGLSQISLATGKMRLFGLDVSALDFFHVAPDPAQDATVEVGSESVDPVVFIKPAQYREKYPVTIVGGNYDLNTLGDYIVKVNYRQKDYDVTMHVTDTVAPTAQVYSKVITEGDVIEASDLIGSIEDKTHVNVTWQELATSESGVYDVEFRLEDEGGNVSSYITHLYMAQKINVPKFEIGGALPDASSFFEGIDGFVVSPQAAQELEISGPGIVKIELLHGDDRFLADAEAIDTTPPTLYANDDTTVYVEMPDPAELVTVEDASAVTVTYSNVPTIWYSGKYDVTVKATDYSGNSAETEVPVFIFVPSSSDNLSAPMIVFEDVIQVDMGDAVPYRQSIRIRDAEDGPIDLYDSEKVDFDTSQVNTGVPGEYTATLRVTDSDGNTSQKTIPIRVNQVELTEEIARSYIESLVQEITNDSMTQEEKLWEIFQYVNGGSGMKYVDWSDVNNPYYLEAYRGFTQLTGDCYTYASMAEAMLDAIGVDYYVVQRNGYRNSDHFWLLVDFGDGWYHYDTCWHAYTWRKPTYKLTDGEAAEFTEWYNALDPGWNYYQFDHDLYPSTPVLNEDGTYTYTPYALSFEAGEGGTIEGEKTQAVAHGNMSTAVTAVPNAGYHFVEWSDGYTEATREAQVIKGNLTVTATFAAD